MSLPVRWSWTHSTYRLRAGEKKGYKKLVSWAKNRIMKYIQTGFQHLIQRIDTSKVQAGFTVPVRISVKGLRIWLKTSEKKKGFP